MFERIKNWVEDHPLLAGGLVILLVVLFFVVRRAVSGGGGSQVVQGGPSEALQAANLQAGVQTQAIQAQADTQNAQLQAQLAALQIQSGTALQIAQLQQQEKMQETVTQGDVASLASNNQLQAAIAAIGGQVSATQIGADRDVAVAGIQSATQIHGYDVQLAIQKDIDAAGVSVAGIQTGGAVDIAGINANRDITINQAQVTGAVDIAGINADVQKDYINTAGAVAMHTVDVNALVDLTGMGYSYDLQKQNQTEFWQSVFANDRWGSGENQVSALNVIAGGNPSIGTAAQIGQAQSNAADSASKASIAGSASRVFTSLFGAAA